MKSVVGNIAVSLDHFLVKDKPFDPKAHWALGPGVHQHKYSCTKKYYPIQKEGKTEGVMWQLEDEESKFFITWIDRPSN